MDDINFKSKSRRQAYISIEPWASREERKEYIELKYKIFCTFIYITICVFALIGYCNL